MKQRTSLFATWKIVTPNVSNLSHPLKKHMELRKVEFALIFSCLCYLSSHPISEPTKAGKFWKESWGSQAFKQEPSFASNHCPRA